MLLAVMRAPLSFFEQTPIGRYALPCLTAEYRYLSMNQHTQPVLSGYLRGE